MLHGLRKYVWNLLIALDQLLNTLLGGDPDEAVSSRLGKAARRGSRYGGWLHDLLERFWPGHCRESIEDDEGQDEVEWRR